MLNYLRGSVRTMKIFTHKVINLTMKSETAVVQETLLNFNLMKQYHEKILI